MPENRIVQALSTTADSLNDLRSEIAVLELSNESQKKINRRLHKIIIALSVSFVLDIILTVFIGIVGHYAYNHASNADQLSNSILQARKTSCLANNQTRSIDKNLWLFVLNTADTKDQTPQQQVVINQFRIMVNKDFAPLNCTISSETK